MSQEKNSNNFDKKNNPKKDDFQWKKLSKTGLIWLVVLFFALVFSTYWPGSQSAEIELRYSEYREFLSDGKIKSGTVTLKENIFRGELKEAELFIIDGVNQEISDFKTILPFIDDTVIEDWEGKGIEVRFVEPSNEWTLVLINALPWILIIVAWIFIARRMQGGGGGGGTVTRK